LRQPSSTGTCPGRRRVGLGAVAAAGGRARTHHGASTGPSGPQPRPHAVSARGITATCRGPDARGTCTTGRQSRVRFQCLSHVLHGVPPRSRARVRQRRISRPGQTPPGTVRTAMGCRYPLRDLGFLWLAFFVDRIVTFLCDLDHQQLPTSHLRLQLGRAEMEVSGYPVGTTPRARGKRHGSPVLIQLLILNLSRDECVSDRHRGGNRRPLADRTLQNSVA
jgi:hypothetical protein